MSDVTDAYSAACRALIAANRTVSQAESALRRAKEAELQAIHTHDILKDILKELAEQGNS